jgi:hypothetical protein
VRNTLSAVAALLLLVQVFSMRWNVVIGGQLLSKSLRGLRSGYEPQFLGREGILVAALLLALPFALLWVFHRVLPEPAAARPAETDAAAAPRRPAA